MAAPTMTNYRLGSLYSVITAFLLATQEPFSFLAARRLTTIEFVLLTQVALLISIPIVTFSSKSRRDFVALFRDGSNYPKLALIFAIGMSGLLLYNLGLAKTHPIIISAVLNLTPFWAAGVALILTKVPIPVSPKVFFGCFVGGFVGAMAVAWSQLAETGRPSLGELTEDFLGGGWLYAFPIPLCSVLGATLVGKWFSAYEESAAVAAQFFVANVILIPATVAFLYWRSELSFDHQIPAIVLMIAGTIIAASIGRVLYQVAMSTTGGDNGFVTMFFNLVPALTAIISFAMSWWIVDLRFTFDPLFFAGLALISVSLLAFSLFSYRAPPRRCGTEGGGV
jgi:drug/metabolite transporter (DMT)-like permease